MIITLTIYSDDDYRKMWLEDEEEEACVQRRVMVWIQCCGRSMLMKQDQLGVERGLPITHVLQVSKRGSGTLLKHKRPRCEAPLKHISLSTLC